MQEEVKRHFTIQLAQRANNYGMFKDVWTHTRIVHTVFFYRSLVSNICLIYNLSIVSLQRVNLSCRRLQAGSRKLIDLLLKIKKLWWEWKNLCSKRGEVFSHIGWQVMFIFTFCKTIFHFIFDLIWLVHCQCKYGYI